MNQKESIQQFLDTKKIAMAGVSQNQKKFGYLIFKELKEKGFDICPVHHTANEIDEVKCVNSVSEIPAGYEKLYIVTPQHATDEILKQAISKGVKHVWIQQKSETSETLKIASENNIELIYNRCMFMFIEPVTGAHKFHRFILKIFGTLPK